MRMLKHWVLLTICMAWTLSSVHAAEQNIERYALVIGNQHYTQAPLKNSINDANAIANSLTEAGFVVTRVLDADFQQLTAQVTAFYNNLASQQRGKALAVVYYAGHAVQVEHDNYLVPLNMEFDSLQQFISGLYKVNNLFDQMNKLHAVQNIIILDACRTNPFEKHKVAFTSTMSNGLAPIKAPTNTLIAFATEPGGVAADGKRKNGIYTKHLLRHLDKQISVEELFKKVRAGVAAETRNKQIPWEHSSLLSETFIVPPKNRDIPDLVIF